MSDNTLDNLQQLEASLPFLAAAMDQKRLGFALEKAAAATHKFDYEIARLNALTQAAEMLWEYMALNHTTDIKEAIEEAEDFGNLMVRASDPAEVEAIARDADGVVREISRFHRAVMEMLERYINANFSSLTVLGQLLGRIGQADLGRRMQQIEQDARQVGRGTAIDLPTKLEALRRTSDALQTELKELTSDPEVDTFLKAVGKGRTSFRMVTPRVLRWLQEHDALDQFYVVSS